MNSCYDCNLYEIPIFTNAGINANVECGTVTFEYQLSAAEDDPWDSNNAVDMDDAVTYVSGTGTYRTNA